MDSEIKKHLTQKNNSPFYRKLELQITLVALMVIVHLKASSALKSVNHMIFGPWVLP